MKNNHCVPPCLRKFHKLGCILYRKKVEKSRQNLVPRSKSDTEIIKLVKSACKRKLLRIIQTTALISSYKGILPLFIYRYAICNQNFFLCHKNIDKEVTKYFTDSDIRKEIYKLLDATVRNYYFSFSNSETNFSFKKMSNRSCKCVHKKLKKNKHKLLQSTEKKACKKNVFGPLPVTFINPKTTLKSRIRSITEFHDDSLLLNDREIEEKRSTSTISNKSGEISNSINDNVLSNKMKISKEDDITSVIKNSLKNYMNDNAEFFENNIKNTCVYESVGELVKEKSKESVLQTHDENMLLHKNGGSKVYLESLLECAEIVNKKLSGSVKHKVMNKVKHVKEHEIFISDFKNQFEKGKHCSNNHTHKKNEFNNFSGSRRNHMCSKKCYSFPISYQSIKINKGWELRYKEIFDEVTGGKIIMKMENPWVEFKKRNNEMYFTYDMEKKSSSTLIKKNINSAKNSLLINNFIRFNLIKQMKNMKLLKSFSDSCVDLGKTSKFACIKSRKNNINYSFHNSNHGTRLMETSTNLLNKNGEISFKKVDFIKYDSTLYCSDKKVYCNHVSGRYQLKKIGKSYSNDSIKKQSMLKTFKLGKNQLEKCGDSDIVTKDTNCSKSEMSYVIYSCDGDKYSQNYEPKQVVDDNQYCFADPDLYYCDSELYLDNEQPDSELKVKSNYEILEKEESTLSLNEGKEKPNLYEEVFESPNGEVDPMVYRNQKSSLKPTKRRKKGSRKGVVKDGNIEHWVHDKSDQSIKSDDGLNRNQKTNSELSILSDFGINCSSYISNISIVNEHRPRSATVTRDVAVSAVCSDEELKPSRSTIDKAIMCDDMNKNEHKHIMQLHTNNIIIESSELIQLNGSSTSAYQSNDMDLSTPTKEKFLKLELYQGESQTKYLEWRQVSNRSDHSIGTPHPDYGGISNDEFFGQGDKSHKSKELEELGYKNNLEFLCNEESHSTQSKNIWSSLKNGSQRVFSFFQPIGPLRTCFKRNIF